MKNILKMTVFASAIVAHGVCSGMMTEYGSGNNGGDGTSHTRGKPSLVPVSSIPVKSHAYSDDLENNEKNRYLMRDGFVAIAYRADDKTKLCMRATDRGLRDSILIDKLVATQKFMLVKEPEFCFNSENNRRLHRAFSLAKKLEDRDAQKNVLELYIMPNDYHSVSELSYWILSASAAGDWDTAISLVKANPHGLCNDKHPNNGLISSRISLRYFVGQDYNKKNEELLKLAESQPRYPQKNHEHCTIL